MIPPETIVCPDCQVPLPPEQVDWRTQRASCLLCGEDLLLRDELMPRAPFEQLLGRCLRPNELPRPEGLRLALDSREAKTTLSLRGRLGWPTTRIVLDERALEIHRFLSRRVIPLREVSAFLAIQTIWTDLVSSEAPRHTEWHVAALTAEARGVPLFPLGRWEPARYMASLLNEALLLRRPHGPYRDHSAGLSRSEPRRRARPSRG